MSDAQGPKNDQNGEPIEEPVASSDAVEQEAAPTEVAADPTPTGGTTRAEIAAERRAADEAPPAENAPAEAATPAAEPADDVDPADDAAPADSSPSDHGDSSTSDEPDYEALAAELDRLETETAAAAPVAPGSPEPAADDKKDPWFEPAKTETFTASEPAPGEAPVEEVVVATAVTASEPTPPAAAPGPIFVQAPEPPRTRGNRGAAGLIGLVGALAFGVLYAAATYGWSLFAVYVGSERATALVPMSFVSDTLLAPQFWVTIIAFWLAFWLLGVFVNRARWWSWVVLGLIVALLTYVGYLVGVFFAAPFWNLTSSEGVELLINHVLHPLGLIAFIIAREVTIWFGAWVSKRGARITKLNAEEREEYDRIMAEGPKAD
ncbi:ABC transporter permease [Microbacterium sp. G2-8]|uniref:ABC transporter permease n=1 Tax=Microbacterium sp. G2-8 TaxID=2842454 RepID=UPI001C8A0DE4|nr:ABC transporter permease [Microbacterium sp. G2-8]